MIFVTVVCLFFASNGELSNCKIVLDIDTMEGKKRQGCGFSHTIEARIRGSQTKPRKIKAKRCGAPKGGGGGGKRRWDTGKCCLNWLSKIVFNILEGQTRGEVGSPVGEQ